MGHLTIVASGSGGHVLPGMSILEEAKKKGHTVSWVGTPNGIETQFLPKEIAYHTCLVQGLHGQNWRRYCAAPAQLKRAFWSSRQFLKAVGSDAVLCMGGYISGPAGLAARSLSIPLLIHESNCKPGWANRCLAPFSQMIFTGFPDVFSTHHSAQCVGNPLRHSFYKQFSDAKRPASQSLHVLVLGGSQGAMAINRITSDAVRLSLTQQTEVQPIQWWHQTGRPDFERQKAWYAAYPDAQVRLSSFIDKMGEAYRWADLVVCRAGAMTVSELAHTGKPAIFIPYPYLKDQHQAHNAHNLIDRGQGIILKQETDTGKKLNALLDRFMTSPNTLKAMSKPVSDKQSAAHLVVEAFMSLCHESTGA
jgi:UDP-N-acetylglucosamine--N-acetylmuramyl-(pentapeptide) pyrophosphoryl-undecaprenol N-acetylglucosamine transferase